jgi:hypothetical protein
VFPCVINDSMALSRVGYVKGAYGITAVANMDTQISWGDFAGKKCLRPSFRKTISLVRWESGEVYERLMIVFRNQRCIKHQPLARRVSKTP